MIDKLKDAHAALGINSFTGKPRQHGAEWAVFSRILFDSWGTIITQLEQAERMREALEAIAGKDKIREFTATDENPETHWVTRDGVYATIARSALSQAKGDL